MGLNWNTVRAEHVARACDMLAEAKSSRGGRSLFVQHKGRELPAKDVLRIAYLLANNLPADSKLKFSSGEGTVARLRSLGFTVERREPPATPATTPGPAA